MQTQKQSVKQGCELSLEPLTDLHLQFLLFSRVLAFCTEKQMEEARCILNEGYTSEITQLVRLSAFGLSKLI